MTSDTSNPPIVFISYSHDSQEHADSVLALSDHLRTDGIDCILDQYEDSPPEGFPRWMERQIRAADFVLMICTPTYYRRVMGDEEPDRGHGVAWESNLIYQYIYNESTSNRRFIPVLLEGVRASDIPVPWQGVKYYRLTTKEGYEELYRRLTGQPFTPKPALGKLRTLPPRERSQDFNEPQPDKRPNNYIPFLRNHLFQPRQGEFEQLEILLFGPGSTTQPARLGLVGVVGMGGVGKTQLAVELAYRCLDQQRFPAGTFWMPATGTSVFEWQHQFAELALSTDYLPPDDDPSSSENEVRRARRFCRYLATHKDAMLILDNVEDPNLVTYVLPSLAGVQVDCPILYTSRNQSAPPGVNTYPVKELPAESSLRLLLETTRLRLLAEILAGSLSAEAQAARNICHDVGYLPLALVHLRGLLARDQQVTLVRLAEVLKQRGALEIAKTQQGDAAPLFATFRLSWEKIGDENARSVFKLAAYFPEAAPIPLWLLGLASGLGEQGDIFEPLGEACLHLQELSLLEELSSDQVRLHPLVREFGRRLLTEESDQGKAFLETAAERLTSEFEDLKSLEKRALRKDYRGCLEQVRAARDYVELLGTGHEEQLTRIERWLDRESYLFRDEQWWPKTVPGLFYQQLYNRSVERGHPLKVNEPPAQWLRQMREVSAEGRSLLRIFAGHSSNVTSVAFSPDGKLVLTGSGDRTARLWETGSGKQVGTLKWHRDWVRSVAFSLDGRLAITCDQQGRVSFWQVNGMERGKLVGLYVAVYEVGDVYWQAANHLVLADLGGPHFFCPHFYYLKLEGTW